MHRMLRLLAVSLMLLIVCSGCARTIVMHPVTDQDIKCDDKGCWMSMDYIKEVMKVRIEEKAK